jgi:hypothetical protein
MYWLPDNRDNNQLPDTKLNFLIAFIMAQTLSLHALFDVVGS